MGVRRPPPLSCSWRHTARLVASLGVEELLGAGGPDPCRPAALPADHVAFPSGNAAQCRGGSWPAGDERGAERQRRTARCLGLSAADGRSLTTALVEV